MEIWQSFVAISWAAIITIVLLVIWRILNWVWLKPKKLEKCLRQQGLTGNSYRLLFGDLKEYSMMIGEAKSKPIHLSDDIVSRVIPFVDKTINNYGKNSFMWFGTTPMVHIMDLELIRDILVKHYDFQRPLLNPLVRLLADGLGNHEGEKWVKHRKIINPAFHQEKLKLMLPAFNLSCSEMISKWEKIISTKGSSELDVWPYLQTLTADVISRTAFGSCYEEGRRIFELQKEQTQLVFQALLSIYIPGWRFFPTKRHRRMKAIDKETEASLRSIIDKRVNAMNAGEASKDDLLGILLENNFQEIEQHGNKNFGLSIKEIMEECKQFYFAGQETTSVLLVWTMILLSQHPSWQVRAREEVFQVFGNDEPDFDRLNHLKIITMILYEVLRLYPPIVMLGRRVFKEIKLKELYLPAGCMVSMPMMLIHRDIEIWGDDAKDFKPERFSEGLSKATKGQVSFFPFGWGPRICIGQNFALLEAKMAMAMILRGFTFELSPSYAHAPCTVTTLQPQYGAHLLLKKL